MKKVNNFVLLIAATAMSLAACANEPFCAYLESSDAVEYKEGMCYQANKIDVVDSAFLISMPSEKDKNGNDIYDITWNTELRASYFTCIEGLKGKRVLTVVRHNEHSLVVNFRGVLEDSEATFGYIKVNNRAFTTRSSRAKHLTYLYSYIAIGYGDPITVKPVESEK